MFLSLSIALLLPFIFKKGEGFLFACTHCIFNQNDKTLKCASGNIISSFTSEWRRGSKIPHKCLISFKPQDLGTWFSWYCAHIAKCVWLSSQILSVSILLIRASWRQNTIHRLLFKKCSGYIMVSCPHCWHEIFATTVYRTARFSRAADGFMFSIQTSWRAIMYMTSSTPVQCNILTLLAFIWLLRILTVPTCLSR